MKAWHVLLLLGIAGAAYYFITRVPNASGSSASDAPPAPAPAPVTDVTPAPMPTPGPTGRQEDLRRNTFPHYGSGPIAITNVRNVPSKASLFLKV